MFFHSASHLMAMAVKNLFPDAKLAIGPAIENGFYYDFDIEQSFTPEDLVKIEKEMTHLVKKSIRPRALHATARRGHRADGAGGRAVQGGADP